MKFLAFEIPNEPGELAGWLERQVVGLDLCDLVVELEALRNGEAGRESLSQIVGDRSPQMLQNGLRELGAPQLRRLLNAPRALLELQEQVSIDGGAYWQSVPRSAEHEAAAARVWERAKTALPMSVRPAPAAASLAGRPGSRASAGTAARRRRVAWLAAAALVLCALSIWLLPAKSPQFAWSRPETYAARVQGVGLYRELSTQLEQYRQLTPRTKRELEAWLREFVNGCDRLLEAPLAQLPDDERMLLRAKCAEWRDKMKVQLAALAAGAPPSDVAAAAEQTTARMIEFLNSHVG